MDFDTLKRSTQQEPKPLFSKEQVTEVPGCTSIEQEYFAYYGIDLENQLAGVQHRFGVIDSGNYRIASHLFEQDGAKGTFFVLHGYYDHVGLFGHILTFFLQQGYNVLAFDLPGHGLSSGEPATIADFSVYTQILADILKACTDRLAKPWHGYGQSTGCAILTDYLLNHELLTHEPLTHELLTHERLTGEQPELDKVIFSAPLVRPWMWPLSRFQLYLARPFIKQLPRTFTDNSRDPDFLKKAHSDPLAPKVLPTQWVSAMDRWIRKIERYRQKSPYKPLIIQGTCDRTVDAKYNIAKLRQLFTDPEVLMLKDARHHLPNELEETRKKYTEWLSSYI